MRRYRRPAWKTPEVRALMRLKRMKVWQVHLSPERYREIQQMLLASPPCCGEIRVHVGNQILGHIPERINL